MDDFYVRYARGILKYRWAVIAFTILASLAMGSGAQYIKFSNDYRYFFSDKNPHLIAFEKMEEVYSAPDNLIWAVKPKDENREATDVDTLTAIYWLTEQAWQTPYSVRVDSLSNYQHTIAEEDDLVVESLVDDPADLTPERADEIKQIVLSEAFLVRRMIAEDAKMTAVIATLNMPDDDMVVNATVAGFARDLADEFRERYPDLRLELTGSVMLSQSFAEAGINDIQTLTPFMYLVIAITVYVMIRSLAGMVTAMFVVAFSAIFAMGAMGWLGWPLTSPSSGAPTIILTVAIADSIHILISMLVSMRKGLDKNEAIVESLRINMQPVFLTSVTTAIGFLALNFSDSPPFHDLGNTSAIGSLWAWVLSITLLPALMSIMPVKAHASVMKQSGFMERYAEFVIQKKAILATGSILALVILASLIPRLTFSDRFVEYFDERVEFRRATDFVAENLTTVYQIIYSVEAAGPDEISDPAYMKTVDDFTDWVKDQPHVINVQGIDDIMKRVNKSMHADDPSYYRIPETRDENAQYLLLYEMSLPYGLDLNDQIALDKSASKVVITYEQVSTQQMEAALAAQDAWFDENLPDNMSQFVASQGIMFAFIGRNNFTSMTQGTIVALVLISGILVLALRSLKLGAISLVPNLAPPIAAFGIVAIFTNEVGLWATFVVATALGLIVDATVHFLAKYRRARIDRGESAEDSVRYAFSMVGTALWVSTFVLIAGFLILSLSPFKVNAMLGLLVAMTVGVALILDFLLLPALLLYLDKKRAGDAPQSATPKAAE